MFWPYFINKKPSFKYYKTIFDIFDLYFLYINFGLPEIRQNTFVEIGAIQVLFE